MRPADLAEARARWRNTTWAAAVVVLALTLLLAAERVIAVRDRTRNSRSYVMATAALVAVLIVARAMVWFAATLVFGPRPLTSPIELLLTARSFWRPSCGLPPRSWSGAATRRPAPPPRADAPGGGLDGARLRRDRV